MGLVARVKWFRRSQDLEELAAEIAAEQIDAVWQRVSARVSSWSTGEMRGYVRAHAALLVQAAIDQRTLAAADRLPLTSLTMDLLVNHVVQRAEACWLATSLRRAA